MKWTMFLSTSLCAFLLVASGCGSHPKQCVPPAKTTKTVTTTIKTERPVPLYKTETTVTSATKSIDSNGNVAPALHDVKIKADVPTPAFKIINAQ